MFCNCPLPWGTQSHLQACPWTLLSLSLSHPYYKYLVFLMPTNEVALSFLVPVAMLFICCFLQMASVMANSRGRIKYTFSTLSLLKFAGSPFVYLGFINRHKQSLMAFFPSLGNSTQQRLLGVAAYLPFVCKKVLHYHWCRCSLPDLSQRPLGILQRRVELINTSQIYVLVA